MRVATRPPKTKKAPARGAFFFSLRRTGSGQAERRSTLVVRIISFQRLAGAAVDAFAQFLAGLEVRHELLGHLHFLPRLRVASDARRATVEAEAAETPNFDAMPFRQGVGHRIEHRFHREIRILEDKLRKSQCQLRDQLGFGHTSADLVRLTGSGRRASPSAARRGWSYRSRQRSSRTAGRGSLPVVQPNPSP